MRLSTEGKANYNPFDTGSEKAKEYDQWCALMDAGRIRDAEEIFKRNNSGMTYEERNG